MERFFRKIMFTDMCWTWVASTNTQGYGLYWHNGNNRRAHRFSYEIFKSKINENMTIDHLCGNKLCVNPGHLEVVTLKENILRGSGVAAKYFKRTHCNNGHEFDGENIYMRYDKKRNQYYRSCRLCKKSTQKIWRLRKSKRPALA